MTELVDRIRTWGIRIDEASVSGTDVEPFLLTPGVGFATVSATLFVFPFPDIATAQAVARRVPPDAYDDNWDWAQDVSYFRCDRMIVLQSGPDGRAGHALRDLCGPPFAEGRRRV